MEYADAVSSLQCSIHFSLPNNDRGEGEQVVEDPDRLSVASGLDIRSHKLTCMTGRKRTIGHLLRIRSFQSHKRQVEWESRRDGQLLLKGEH
jgi:hypothetical protein